MDKAVSRTCSLFHKPYKAALEPLIYFLYDLIAHEVVLLYVKQEHTKDFRLLKCSI